MCPKIVQKYIERPFLLEVDHEKRKFDIRQWVFVSSFDPLQVFIYRKAYLRICGADFQMSMYEDPMRHLSNYSIQKDDELIMSSDEFTDYLKQRGHEKTWEEHFLPQIDNIVKITLR